MLARSRWVRASLVVAALAAVFWACDHWTAWDAMFTRTALNLETKGWNGGDAAISAPLPNGRTLYLFGDSYMTNRTTDNRRVQLGPDPDPWTPLRHSVFGNTIGVQRSATPDASNIDFYARANGTAQDITNVPNAAFTPYRQFFDHAALGLPLPSDGTQRYFWPIGAECYQCDNAANARLLVALMEWTTCNPAQNTDQNVCMPMCDLTSVSNGTCEHGVSLTANVLAKFKDIDKAPSAWTRDGAALRLPGDNRQTQWGGSFLIEGTSIYVYGARPIGYGQHELLVRRTSIPYVTVGTPSQWTVWRTDWYGRGRWLTGTRVMRPVATGVPAYYSIDKFTRNSIPRYVLTYTQLGQKLFVRVSGATLNASTTAATWAGESVTTPRLDLFSVDATIRRVVFERYLQGCEPNRDGAIPHYYDCAVTYHGLALGHLPMSDQLGPKTVPVSYIVAYGPNPYFDATQPESLENPRFGAQSADYYRPRFAYIDLGLLEPWCENDCWQGIARRYMVPAVPSTYSFDVTDVTSGRLFYAALNPGAGSPTLTVEYTDGSRVLRTDVCAPSSLPVCHAAPPAGARIANVKLSGPADSTASALDVHHAGKF